MLQLNGKVVAEKLKQEIAAEIANICSGKKTKPTLAVVSVAADDASKVYVNNKQKAAIAVGMGFAHHALPAKTTQKQLEELIKTLNDDSKINGIILQLPVPKHLNARAAINKIAPHKDVDGLTDVNIGKLATGDATAMIACTASGVMELLNYYNVVVAGKNVVIINRSLLVGKPLTQLFLAANATVTVCHTKTLNLKQHTRAADILICATGQAGLINKSYIKRGSVLIDVSICRGQDGKLCGDVDYNNVSTRAAAVSPVPGGVGPLTVACLLKNTLTAYKVQHKIK